MIICHCNVVRADEVRSEVRLGATTVELVSARCGAAARCEGCVHAVAEVIADELHRSQRAATVPG